MGVLIASCVEIPLDPSPVDHGPIEGLLVRVGQRSLPYVLVGERINMSVEPWTTSGFFVPATGVSFESADPLVASVSASGELRGLRAGTALLTVRANGRSVTMPIHVRGARCTAPLVTRTTTPDATLDGSIGLASCVLDEYGAAEGWRLTLTVPTTIMLDRTEGSDSLFLVVTDGVLGTTVPEASSVIGGHGDRARAVRTLAPGTYHLLVASARFDSSSAFRVRVTPRVACTPGTASEPGVPDGDLIRTFGASDCVLPNGFAAKQWVLQPLERTIYSVQTVGQGTRVFSTITGPDGIPLWDTQSIVQGDTGLVSSYDVPPGRHVLWVVSRGLDTFTLSLRTPAVCTPDEALAVLALGDTLRGTLSVEGCRSSPDHLGIAQPYAVQVTSAGTLEVDLITPGMHGVWIALRSSDGATSPFATTYLPPGTLRHTASVTPGVWQVLVSGFGYIADADYALLVRGLP